MLVNDSRLNQVDSAERREVHKPQMEFGEQQDMVMANNEIPGKLGDLINELKKHLGGKGLSCKDINVEEIQKIMESYEAADEDWAKYGLHDSSRNYTRNGIVNINGNANLLILCWSPGKSSAIHDHANAHCVMKILKGNLKESLYNIPNGEAMELKKETILQTQQVGYISDDIGLHKISNPDDTVSVSLHLYTPPYASLYGCSMYDANGVKHHVDMSKYYSWQGELVNKNGGSTC
ncbi:cysteine dioxygenase Cdg1p [[Candida] jaroonii]|uniref:Cysteine dioxygenase Cdg1p n=1 Tax=[Candida] jaroonii TaxID=467808 RepID=A0ACA9YEF1_9ASCO|nr:cysteine dioxygenase Cdg1p [[Candida] jaroonii]